ncbi:MAG: PilT/PilU family type 4a pilus ATPase [Puniceicoccales bacterium]|jgi:twitching motility protein PilT|nr:PilT/PilU family type 4a pilus ATPase [Puniceicoccales bacterium]
MTLQDTSARTLLDSLLTECVSANGSDIHLAPEEKPYFRVHGILVHRPKFEVMTNGEIESLLPVLLSPERIAVLTKDGAVDGAMSASDGTRFRFNAYRRDRGVSIALRKLDDKFRPLTELGLPDSLYELGDLPDGLVLLAGPAGSGKTTTLATLLDYVNRTRECHIITIEDPIEYIHASQHALVDQRQVGKDTPGFQEALVNSLRQDPDVILVGEIREVRTIRTAITAAETGHLVFSTVHAGDCVGAIERLVSVFPSDEQPGVRRQLALNLRAIIAQHLIRADGPAASGKGIKGAAKEGDKRPQRVLVSEILRVTPAVANLIATEKSMQIYAMMESGAAHGMKTLEADLARLWAFDLISENTAVSLSKHPSIVRERHALIQRQRQRV